MEFIKVNNKLIKIISTEESITIPDGITCISEHVLNEAIGIKELIIPFSVIEIERDAFSSNTLESIIFKCDIKSIGSSMFECCTNLKQVKLPKNLEYICWHTFSRTTIEEIEIPDNVRKIDFNTFENCKHLKRVKLPKNLEIICYYAFYGTAIEEIEIPDNVIKIEYQAFENCKHLKRVKLPENLEIIGAYAFKGTGIEEIEIPDNVTVIGTRVFADCKHLKRVKLPENLIEIGEGAFEGCNSLEKIIIPNSVEKIKAKAFLNAENLREIILPKQITIGSYAFSNSGIEYINIPSSVRKLDHVFSNCKNLHTVKLESISAKINDFDHCNNLKHLKISAEAKKPSRMSWEGFNNDTLESIELDPMNKELILSEDHKSLLNKDGSQLLFAINGANPSLLIKKYHVFSLNTPVTVHKDTILENSKFKHIKYIDPDISNISVPITIKENGINGDATNINEFGPGLFVDPCCFLQDKIIFNSREVLGLENIIKNSKNLVIQAPFIDPIKYDKLKKHFVLGIVDYYEEHKTNIEFIDSYKQIINENIMDFVYSINTNPVFQDFIVKYNLLTNASYKCVNTLLNTKNQEFNIYLLGLSERDALSFDSFDDNLSFDEQIVDYTLNFKQTSDKTCKIVSIRNFKTVDDCLYFIIPNFYKGLKVTEMNDIFLEDQIWNKNCFIRFENTSITKLDICLLLDRLLKRSLNLKIEANPSLKEIVLVHSSCNYGIEFDLCRVKKINSVRGDITFNYEEDKIIIYFSR